VTILDRYSRGFRGTLRDSEGVQDNTKRQLETYASPSPPRSGIVQNLLEFYRPAANKKSRWTLNTIIERTLQFAGSFGLDANNVQVGL